MPFKDCVYKHFTINSLIRNNIKTKYNILKHNSPINIIIALMLTIIITIRIKVTNQLLKGADYRAGFRGAGVGPGPSKIYLAPSFLVFYFFWNKSDNLVNYWYLCHNPPQDFAHWRPCQIGSPPRSCSRFVLGILKRNS